MALTAQQQADPSWGRWSQQMPQNFPIMGSPGFMPYDHRAQADSQMQRQVSAQYLMNPNYNHSPISTASSPHCQNQCAFSYVPYQSPPPSTPLGSPFKTEFHRHSDMSMENAAADRRNYQSMKEYQPYSPISRRESVSSVVTMSSTIQGPLTPSATTPGSGAPSPFTLSPFTPSPLITDRLINSKTLTYNETLNPADSITFKTDVDELMKAIQGSQAKEECQQLFTPAPTPKNILTHPPTLLTQSGKPRKQWACDGPNCGRAFTQKTHRDIHRRTHTGQRPYVCDRDNCGLTFSQRGNLRTHIRRHTGEKPYACTQCTKCFAQRGNLRAHEETHKGLKPFICRLDNCNKAFSQLGNMKTHQNHFHKATIQKLIVIFVQFSEHGNVPEDYRELFDYFQKHYKNSNKGIKGRGKTRAVTAREPLHSVASQLPQMAMPAQDPMVSTSKSSPYALPEGSTNILSSVLRNPNPSYSPYGSEPPHQMGISNHLRY
ncbi:hypothetical protein ACHAQJ_008145 [Trichoderma viride]